MFRDTLPDDSDPLKFVEPKCTINTTYRVTDKLILNIVSWDTLPSSSMIVTVVVSKLMVTGKQVDISLMVMVNILSPSCIMLSIMSTSNDDDVIPAVIVTLYTSD